MIWYRNSILASIVSIVGSLLVIVGIGTFSQGTGILLILVGIGCIYGGKVISDKRAEEQSFSKWWKKVEKAGLISEIRQSRDTAVEIYKKNPESQTLEKIRSLNPAAAKYIENGFREPAEPVRPAAAPPKPAPVQSTAQPLQTPISVQRGTTEGNHPKETMEQIMQEVIANARGDNDPVKYWECAQRLEVLYDRDRNNTVLRENLSSVYYFYVTKAFRIADESPRKRTEVFNAIQRSMYLAGDIKPDTRDYYAYMLLRHAVDTVLEATVDKNRNEMLSAYQRLDLVANERIVGVDDFTRDRLVYNDAVRIARAWLCFWLASSFFQEEQKNRNLAKMYIDEALRYCPTTPSRNCDLNPKTLDQTVIMNRSDLQRMRDIIYA